MKLFEHFNTTGPVCPVCGTKDDKQAVLIPIAGTAEDGICEAVLVHLNCINLYAYSWDGSFYFKVD